VASLRRPFTLDIKILCILFVSVLLLGLFHILNDSHPMTTITLDHIKAALALPNFDFQQAQLKMLPPVRRMPQPEVPPREAGVLVLLYPHSDETDLRILLTRRTETLRGHSGQISFPGGRREEADDSFAATALRETSEELGITDFSQITLLGSLSKCYIPPSNYDVYPFVGYTPVLPPLVPSPYEVAEVLSLSLVELLHPATHQQEMREFQGLSIAVPYYQLSAAKVWGATAAMLSELEQRLRGVLPSELIPS
jgi:8-oxo-dGTP pyrophosphatase MutT (NUDIX family)